MIKNFWFKEWFVIMEKNRNGSISVTASNDDNDYIREVFYDYPMREIMTRIRSHIRYRIQNPIY